MIHRFSSLLAVLVGLAGSATAQSPFTTCAEERAVLFPPPNAGASSPSAVAVAGSAVAIGMRTLFGNASNVFVHRDGPDGYSIESRLVGSPLQPDGGFGRAVAMQGDRLLVGAQQEVTGGFDAGAAYVFEYDGADWNQAARLVASDLQGGMALGAAVAIDETRALVSSPARQSPSGAIRGAAYVFRRGATSWTQEGILLPPPEPKGARAGGSVALDGDYAAVGTLYLGQGQPGSVFIYWRDPDDGWQLDATVSASDAIANDSFGSAVALDRTTLIVGAPLRAQSRGKAYLFRRSGGTWTEIAQLDPADVVPFRRFGWTVFVEGAVLGVGAVETFGGSGSVRVYHESAGVPSLLAVLRPSFPPFAGTQFSNSLAVDGTTLVVGTNDVQSFVFELGPECPRSFCQAKINSLFCYPGIESSGLASLSTTQSFEVTGRSIVPDELGVLLYGTSGRGNVPFHGGKLCVKAPIVRLFPAKNSGHSGPGLCSGVLSTDFNARIQSGADPALEPGTRVVAQWLYRDPPVDAFGDGLTEALEFVVAP